jgi:hypothetical protein
LAGMPLACCWWPLRLPPRRRRKRPERCGSSLLLELVPSPHAGSSYWVIWLGCYSYVVAGHRGSSSALPCGCCAAGPMLETAAIHPL